VLSRFVSPATRARLLGLLATCSVAMLIGFIAQPNLAVALGLLGLSGATGAYIITVTATFSSWVPNNLRGGASGLYRTGVRVAQGLGVAAGGAMAELVGSASDTTAFAGVAGVLLAIPVALSWRRLRQGEN
jgi:predicted MFS family arabinose efflux permease